MMNRKSKNKKHNQSSSTPSESDDAFAAAAAAAAAAASAADAATLSGWDNPNNNTNTGSNRSLVAETAAAAGGGGTNNEGGGNSSGDDQPDAISHSARLALSSSIRHHANLLRDADQTIEGFDQVDDQNATTTAANPFDVFARSIRGDAQNAANDEDEERGVAFAPGLSHRSISSQQQQQEDGSQPHQAIPPPPSSHPGAFFSTSQASFQSSNPSLAPSSTSTRTIAVQPSVSSMTPLYTLPKALLFRAVLAVISLGAALALAIVHGGGKLGLEASSLMYEKTILEGGRYGGVGGGGLQGQQQQPENGILYDSSSSSSSSSNAEERPSSSSSTATTTSDATLNIPNLESMNLEIAPAIHSNFAELTATTTTTLSASSSFEYVPKDGVPLFWQIPQSGGNVMKHILGKCLGVVEASEVAAGHNEPELQVFETNDGTRYVNVDTTTYAGLQRATNPNINLASSGLLNLVIFTPLLHPASNIFTPQYTAKFFALFRHPVDRVVSKFHQDTKDDMELQDMTIAEYVQNSGRVENNWITRFLVDKAGGGVTQDDAYLAMEVLRRKCVVGLVDHLDESMLRFETAFGWSGAVESAPGVKECKDSFLESANHHLHHGVSVEEGSEAWDIIMMNNQYDYQVYKYAQYLFWSRVY